MFARDNHLTHSGCGSDSSDERCALKSEFVRCLGILDTLALHRDCTTAVAPMLDLYFALPGDLDDGNALRRAVWDSYQVVYDYQQVFTLDDPLVDFEARRAWINLEYRDFVGSLGGKSQLIEELKEYREKFEENIHGTPRHWNTDSQRNKRLGILAEVASAVRLIGGELKCAETAWREHLHRQSDIPRELLLERAIRHLSFLPDAAHSETRVMARTMNDLIRSSDSEPSDERLFRRLWEAYDELCRTAFWPQRPRDVRIIEFSSHVTGMPLAVLEEIEAIERTLCIDRTNPAPQNGFLYAPSVTELDDYCSTPGARLVHISYDGRTCGFYLAYLEPGFFPDDVQEIIRLAHEKGFIPRRTRVSWSEIIGIGETDRAAMKERGLDPYGVIDDAILHSNIAEQIEMSFALVRHDNLAVRAHFRRRWEDTGIVVMKGPNHDVAYRVLRRWVSKQPIDRSLETIPTTEQKLTFPAKVLPELGLRVPSNHAPWVEPGSDVESNAPHIQDHDSIAKISEWQRRMGIRNECIPLFCSDGLAVMSYDSRGTFVFRQIQPRRDLWRCETIGDSRVGTLDQVFEWNERPHTRVSE